MGVGVFARLQHTPGIRQWDPRAENWVPICASNMGPESETEVPLSLRLLLEMGGVCYQPGRPIGGVGCDGPGLVTTGSCWARRCQTDQRSSLRLVRCPPIHRE